VNSPNDSSLVFAYLFFSIYPSLCFCLCIFLSVSPFQHTQPYRRLLLLHVPTCLSLPSVSFSCLSQLPLCSCVSGSLCFYGCLYPSVSLSISLRHTIYSAASTHFSHLSLCLYFSACSWLDLCVSARFLSVAAIVVLSQISVAVLPFLSCLSLSPSLFSYLVSYFFLYLFLDLSTPTTNNRHPSTNHQQSSSHPTTTRSPMPMTTPVAISSDQHQHYLSHPFNTLNTQHSTLLISSPLSSITTLLLLAVLIASPLITTSIVYRVKHQATPETHLLICLSSLYSS
jgi:hypothetical protein